MVRQLEYRAPDTPWAAARRWWVTVLVAMCCEAVGLVGWATCAMCAGDGDYRMLARFFPYGTLLAGLVNRNEWLMLAVFALWLVQTPVYGVLVLRGIRRGDGAAGRTVGVIAVCHVVAAVAAMVVVVRG